MTLSLCYYGHPVLRRKAEPVAEFGPDLERLARDMVETMRAESGIGLAGPQVGRELRIFTMDLPPEMDVDGNGARLNPDLACPLVVVNPEIQPDPSDGEEEMEEGCLSIPDIRGRVRRPVSVRMRFQDVKGAERVLDLSGLAARCAQHELDHLNGVLFIDHLGAVKKRTIKGKLKRLKARVA